MIREEVLLLFVEMGKEIRFAAGKWLKGDREAKEDAAHEALLLVANMAFAGPAEARAGILAAAEKAGFRIYQQQKEHRRRFPQPSRWVLRGRRLVIPGEPVELEDNPLNNVPDDRPDPEEEAIRKECEEAVAALARRLGHDPSWRGELYRLMYVEGKTLAATAKALGISEKTAQKRVERLREYLRDSKEGKQVVKGRRGT